MEVMCVTCGEQIQAGDYRLVGVEKHSWASQYAHRGNCETEARERFRGQSTTVKRDSEDEILPEVEELTLEEPAPFPDEGLPWFGMERR